MKKIVRLTESDLTRIVKRVVNEGVTITLPEITAMAPGAPSGTFKFDTTRGLELFDAQGKALGTWSFNENPIQENPIK